MTMTTFTEKAKFQPSVEVVMVIVIGHGKKR